MPIRLSPDAIRVCQDDYLEQKERIRDAIEDAKHAHRPGFRLFATKTRNQLARHKAGTGMKAKALLRRLP